MTSESTFAVNVLRAFDPLIEKFNLAVSDVAEPYMVVLAGPCALMSVVSERGEVDVRFRPVHNDGQRAIDSTIVMSTPPESSDRWIHLHWIKSFKGNHDQSRCADLSEIAKEVTEYASDILAGTFVQWDALAQFRQTEGMKNLMKLLDNANPASDRTSIVCTECGRPVTARV